MTEPDLSQRRVFHSWKEIAVYLHASVRSVQRWAKTAGLPVHRTGVKRPVAYADELDAWMKSGEPSRSEQATPLRKGLLLLLIPVLLALLVGGLAVFPFERTPSRLLVEGTRLRVLDEKGRLYWEKDHPGLTGAAHYGWMVSEPDLFLLEDLDGDARPEIIFNYLTRQDDPIRGSLFCYETDGALRWKFKLGRNQSFRSRTLDDDFSAHILRLVKVGAKRYLLATATHKRWFPTQVVLIDPVTGSVVDEYWHPGALSHCLIHDLDDDGRPEVVLAGVNNPGQGPGHPALLVLDCPFAATDPNAGPLTGFGQGKELRYLLFCRPDISAASGVLLLINGLSAEPGGHILVRVRVAPPDAQFRGISLFYLFDRQFRLRDFQYSEGIVPLHDDFWERRLLDHRFSSTEALCWSRVHSFPTAPDGNDPGFTSLCEACLEESPVSRSKVVQE